MSSKRETPEVSDDLLKHLSERFPNQLPPLAQATERELLLRIGEQRVVDHLRSLNRKDKKSRVHPVTKS